MKTVIDYKKKYATYWRTLPEVWWFPRLLQEIGELADTFTGETEDTRTHELRQIASICLNWLDMRGEWVEGGDDESSEDCKQAT